MKSLFWRFLAKLLARPSVADWIIKRAQRTPYDHLAIADGSRIIRLPHDTALWPGDSWYMRRWWFLRFGPLQIRVHHILLADIGRDMHDHPWNARTIILRGSYTEQRLIDHADTVLDQLRLPPNAQATEYIDRKPGCTATLRFGEYHRIDSVSDGGVYTLFISGPKQGTWGFLVNGVKVPWRKYLGLDQEAA